MNEGKPSTFRHAIGEVTFSIRVMRDEEGV